LAYISKTALNIISTIVHYGRKRLKTDSSLYKNIIRPNFSWNT